DDLHAFGVANEGVPELDLNGARIFDVRLTDFADDAGTERVVDVHYYQTAIAGDVGVRSRNRDVVRAVENAVGVPCQSAFEEIVGRVGVEQRRHARFRIADHDQPFVPVGRV